MEKKRHSIPDRDDCSAVGRPTGGRRSKLGPLEKGKKVIKR